MKKAKILLVLVAAILLLGAFALNVAAAEELTDVYLSANGDDTNPGTQEAPVQSLNKALELVADGGTVHIVDSYTAPAGFVWESHGKDVTITGGKLDLSEGYTEVTDGTATLKCYNQGDAVTYDGNLELVLVDGAYYFANGFRLQVNETVTITCQELWLFGGGYKKSVSGVNVKLLGGDYNRIYGGSYKSGVSGDINLYVGKVNPNYTSSHDGTTRLYGACSSGNVTGDVNLTIAGANLDYVSGVSHTNTCGVSGKVNVLMTGGSLYSLYAGGTNAQPGGGIYLTMTGGTVAQVFGTGSSDFEGNIQFHLKGGTITRRFFGGCYNNWLFSYSSDYHVTGNIDVFLYEEMNLNWDTSEDDAGFFAHSRYSPLFSDEVTNLYYVGTAAQTKHQNNLGSKNSGMKDTMGSSTAVADTISTITTEVEKWNVVLGDDLGVNFYVSVPEAVAKVSQLEVTFDGQTKTYDLSEQKPYETGLYLIPVDVAAAQMTEPITLQLVVGGTECESVSYTIRKYAEVILSGSYSDQIQTLVKHMLDYGTAAQNYFGINTTDPANVDYVLDYTAQWPADYPAVTTDGEISDINFYGASLILDNRTAIRYYFEASSVEGVTFTANGRKYTPVQKGSMYYVEVPGILPHEYSESIVLTAVKGTEKLEVSYSPLTYMVRMNQKGSDTLKTLVNAMYGYHEAAAAYMNNVTILTGPIQLEQVLTGIISVKPSEYTVGTQIAENAGNLSAEAFAASVKLIKVVSEDGKTWFVDAEGKLALAVASIEDTLYISLEDALTAANATAEADTITLLGDVTASEQLQVTEDVTIIADKPVTVTGTASVFNVASGKSLTVAGTESTKISIVCSDTTVNVIYNEGSLSIEHVNISGGYNAIYAEEGTITTMSHVAISDAAYRGIHGNGALVVQNVTIDGTTNHGIYLGAKASVTGSSLTVKNTGNNGIFSEGADMTISGLTIENTSQQGVQVKGGTIQFSDFTMKGTGSATVRVREDAQMTLNGGTIYADTYGIAADGTSNTIVTDVTIERTGKKTDALVNIAGNATMGINGTTKIDGKGFKGHGVNVAASTATFTVNGGTVTGNTADGYADVVLTSGATIALHSALTEQVTVKPGAYTVGTVVAEKADELSAEDFASSMEQILVVPSDSKPWIVDADGKLAEAAISIGNIGYTTLEAAVAAANAMEEAATITVSVDVTVKQLTIKNDVTIVNGKTDSVLTVTGSATVFNVAAGKTLTITGTESARIAIVGSDTGKDVIYSSGTVNLSYVDISGGQKGINIQNGGHLEASYIQVTGTSGQAVYFTGANATGSVSNFVVSETGSAAVRPMNGAQVTLTDGTIYADTYGIAVDGSSGAVLTNVTIERTGKKTDALVNIAGSATLELSGTTKIDGKGYAGHGVNVAASTATFTVNGGTVTGNTAEGYADVVLASGATIQLKQALTAAITVKPGEYTEGLAIAAKDDELSDDAFVSSMDQLVLTDTDWTVDETGCLKENVKAVATIGDTPYTSLEDAVAAANAAAEAVTITVCADVTVEQLNIQNDVTIVSGKTDGTLTITGTASVFRVAADKSLTLTGTESAPIAIVGVKGSDVVYSQGTVNLTYVNISNGKKGINIQNGGKLEASHIQVTGTTEQAVYFTGASATANISSFVISESASAAVRPMNGAQVTLTDGTIYADTYGVAVDGSSGAVLTNVTIERTGKKTDALVNIAGSATLEIAGTTKIDGKGYAGHGVNVAASTATFTVNGGTVTGNTAEGYADVVLASGATVQLKQALTDAITVKPGEYTEGLVIAVKGGEISDSGFASSMKQIVLASEGWHVADTGVLAKTEAILNSVHYTSLEAAITAAEAGSTVKVVRDATLTQTVTKAITLTADKAVTVTESDDVTSHMFSITSGTLTITGASEDAKIKLQAGTATLALVHTNGGNAELTNVDLLGNSASTAASNGGRGIYNEAGTVTAKSVNIQNMVKGDGIYVKAGATLNLDNVTIVSANRYSIKTYGTVNIYNTIHADHALTIRNSYDHAIDIDSAGVVNSTLTNVPDGAYAINIDTTRKSSAIGILVRAGGEANVSYVSITNTKEQGVYFYGTSATKTASGSISDFAISKTGTATVELKYSTATLTNGTVDKTVVKDANSTLTENNVTVVE